MTSVAERLREYFDHDGVAYRIIAHEAAASADQYHDVLGTRFEQMPKAIFLRYEDKGGKRCAILALQGHKHGLERVRRGLDAVERRCGSDREHGQSGGGPERSCGDEADVRERFRVELAAVASARAERMLPVDPTSVLTPSSKIVHVTTRPARGMAPPIA